MYKYDTHVHTYECSLCAVTEAREMVRRYADAGYSGFVITNHFYGGNTRIDRSLSWGDFVRPYWDCYLEAKDEGEKLGFDVIFGIEEGVGNWKEWLIYNIDIDVLNEMPDFKRMSNEERSKLIHDAGGFISHAHPYRFRQYMKICDEPDFSYVDAVEVYNAHNAGDENERAFKAAQSNGLFMTVGSDNHSANSLASPHTAMLFENRVRTGAELVEAIKSPSTRYLCDGKLV